MRFPNASCASKVTTFSPLQKSDAPAQFKPRKENQAMGLTVKITLPEKVLLAAGYPKSEAASMLKMELAGAFFQRGVLSFGPARQLAELSVWEFLDFLRERKIPLHYDKADYEEDCRTVEDLL